MATMKLGEFIHALVQCSEKAAHLARLIRSEKSLFDLLVEEKTGDSKNKRFIQDFKTLADVLVQETIKHDLGQQFAGIEEHIFGEESNKFTNTLGETVTVSIQATREETAKVLAKVLDGNDRAASLLSGAVHQSVTIEMDPRLRENQAEVAIQDLGVWIDPIDSTAQYIHGYESVQAEGGVYREGLQCVVVLIGAYLLNTGRPVAGVMNQPFSVHSETHKQWEGRCLWGVSHPALTLNSIPRMPGADAHYADADTWVVMSTSEGATVKTTLTSGGDFRLTFASGAGYKILCAVDGLVGAYVLSQGTTFKWDTCGPQAILDSFGADALDYHKAVRIYKENHVDKPAEEICALLRRDASLRYHEPDSEALTGGQQWSNSGGIIAYRDQKVLLRILHKLM